MMMKHVVIAASFRQIVMVTGFGAFPGARRNPTSDILRRLELRRSALSRLGVDLRCVHLPVVYAAIGPTLEAAVSAHCPVAILHLGLAGRRRRISIETRAINRACPLHPDAAKALPRQHLAPGRASVLRATYPAARLATTLRRAGHATELSIDAGDYVCNATLFHSLRERLAPSVGFIHVPRTRGTMRKPQERPTIEDLTRAVELAVREMARPTGLRSARRDHAGAEGAASFPR